MLSPLFISISYLVLFIIYTFNSYSRSQLNISLPTVNAFIYEL